MTESCKNRFRIRTVWIGLFMVAMLFANVPAQAAESNEVPVKLTVTSEGTPIRLGDDITIEAVTEKKGDTFQIYGSHDISYETREENGFYISKGTFHVDFIGSKLIEYNIIMYGNGEKWTGKGSVFINAKDNMPPVLPGVPATITLSPGKSYEVGKQIKFTVATPAKGEYLDKTEFQLFRNGSRDTTQTVENVRTTKRRDVYSTTGYFTPTEAGEYKVEFYLLMYENESAPYLGKGVAEFSVKENPTIAVSLSPNMAYMNAGEEIYLSVAYPLNKDSDSSEHYMSWNYPNVVELIGTYDDDFGGYKYVYRFKPEKKGTYNLEVSVKQDSNGQIREGKAKAKIYVR